MLTAQQNMPLSRSWCICQHGSHASVHLYVLSGPVHRVSKASKHLARHKCLDPIWSNCVTYVLDRLGCTPQDVPQMWTGVHFPPQLGACEFCSMMQTIDLQVLVLLVLSAEDPC